MADEVDDVTVLIPDRLFALTAVSLDQLVGYLAQGDSLEEATTNAGFESADTPEEVVKLIARVKALNETGDSDAFWE